MTTIKSAKAALRKSLRQKLANIPPESLAAQSTAVTRHITSHPAFQRSNCIACYLSMSNGEIQADDIVHAALSEGKTLYVPRLTTRPGPSPDAASFSAMELLRVHSKEDLQANLVPGVWGIREPSVEYNGARRETAASPASPPIDLILMPGMAFDRTLARLGHGKGYYDRFVSEYRAFLEERQESHKVLLCGLSLEEQMLEDGSIPMTERDVRLDMIVTAREILS